MEQGDVSDPSDWSNTALSSLYPLDSNLRCLICKDFYTAPVITTCLHTFCSLCIRRSLSAEPICPACRTPNISDNGLRQNKVVADLVENFLAARFVDFSCWLIVDRCYYKWQRSKSPLHLPLYLFHRKSKKGRKYRKSNQS
jgi:DNA repair protein Rad18